MLLEEVDRALLRENDLLAMLIARAHVEQAPVHQ
jgi:hypothetical protein